ncbi:MAG TPA: aminotransferase class I/II-fold pyridoxal phosphate-dependent enzyme, partial [Actinotalea sp.]|nr:aminotransferase class I/II-fold pyridoxal phosphate-dependent enzyme [Actinotalea sp.]
AVATYRSRRDEAIATLTSAGLRCTAPQGAFYLLVDVSEVFPDGHRAALRLLAEEHVAVAPGEAFGNGGAGWVRISLASSDDSLRAGLASLVALVERERAALGAGHT